MDVAVLVIAGNGAEPRRTATFINTRLECFGPHVLVEVRSGHYRK